MIHALHFIGAYLAAYLLYLPVIACVNEYLEAHAESHPVGMAHLFAFCIALQTL